MFAGTAEHHAQGSNKRLLLQADKFLLQYTPSEPIPVKTPGKGFDIPRKVVVGDRFVLSAGEIGRKALPAQITLKLGNAKFKFAANCKYPIRLGDEFGPLKVAGFETKPGPDCDAIMTGDEAR